MSKMRTTTHHGRGKAGGAGKAFGSKHNDRNFDIAKANHIDPELVKNNVTWNLYDGCTFEEAELRFYEKNFQHQLDETNDNYKANGHSERCKKMDAWKKSRRHAPEESLIQIGDKHNTGKYVDGDTLLDCYSELLAFELEWNEEHNRPFTILNYALHVDEPGCPPHIHSRKVWHFRSEDGSLFVGQERALEQAGIELPNPEKNEGRYNNRKMTYDAMVREKWLDICQSRGIEIEREPLPTRKKSKDLEDHIRDKYNDLLKESESLEAFCGIKTMAERDQVAAEANAEIDELATAIHVVDEFCESAKEEMNWGGGVGVRSLLENFIFDWERIRERVRELVDSIKEKILRIGIFEHLRKVKPENQIAGTLQKSLDDTLTGAQRRQVTGASAGRQREEIEK